MRESADGTLPTFSAAQHSVRCRGVNRPAQCVDPMPETDPLRNCQDSCWWLSAAHQQPSKGFDFFCHEVTKRPYPRRPSHVTVKDQIEVQREHQGRAQQPDKIGLVLDGSNREGSKASA